MSRRVVERVRARRLGGGVQRPPADWRHAVVRQGPVVCAVHGCGRLDSIFSTFVPTTTKTHFLSSGKVQIRRLPRIESTDVDAVHVLQYLVSMKCVHACPVLIANVRNLIWASLCQVRRGGRARHQGTQGGGRRADRVQQAVHGQGESRPNLK
jgi:hypothetical protein